MPSVEANRRPVRNRFVPLRWMRLATAAVAGTFAIAPGPAAAQTRIVFGTNWYAEAEHGGFYQAIAEGIYAKYGLDVEVKMGGPQVNGPQLLLAGQYDLYMGDDFQTLKAVERGLPMVTLGASFQRDPVALLAHPDVKRIEDLKTRSIFVGQTSESTFWPWLKSAYGFTDEQKKRYTFSVQPFLVDTHSATQGYVTSEPYTVAKGGVTPVIFLLGDLGYPPYAETIVATRDGLAKNADAFRRFLQASAEGWKSYLAHPEPGDALIRKANPQVEPDLLAFSVAKMREYKLVTGGDAATRGILTISGERYKKIRDFMVGAGLLAKEFDYTQAYTTRLIDQVHVLPSKP
jgi:NitT/TauT family transport system substrate-binding protein